MVYVRRGSSTAEAEPDEISKMGQFDSTALKSSPSIELSFFDKEMGKCSGRELKLCPTILRFPEHRRLPDYGRRNLFDMGYLGDNKDYYRELAEYYSVLGRVNSIGFAVTNTGNTLAANVRLEIQIEDNDEEYLFLDRSPEEPSTSRLPFVEPYTTFGIGILSE